MTSNNTDAPIAGTVGAGKLTDLPKVCDEILRAVKPDTDFGFVRIAGSYTGIREYNLVALVNDHAQLLSENAELRADVERLKRERFDADSRLSQFEGFVHGQACPHGGRCLCEAFAAQHLDGTAASG